MTRLEQIERIYQAAVDQPGEERVAYLERSCGEDIDLRREVESLLRYDDERPNFMDSPPAFLAAQMFAEDVEESDLVGKEISRYKLEWLIGEGGMGKVYLAEDLRLHRRVALKVLPPNIVGDAERLMRFEREAQAVSALNHPNILTVHEFGEADGIHFIASEFVDGVTLRQKITAFGPSDLSETLDVAIQVSSALSAAHEAGIAHRDIKPENIMIRRDGYIKVLDFGLAKLAQPQAMSSGSGSEDATQALHRTRPGVIMGTAAYMSPEQARGKQVDARTDIWSLGVVAYEMLTGERPFSGDSPADIIVSVLSSEPPPLSSQAHGIPPELDWIVSKALTKNVEARYQTAKELRADLDKIKKRLEFEHSGSRLISGELRDDHSKEDKRHSTAEPVGPTSGGERLSTGHSVSFLSGIEVVFREAREHKARSAMAAMAVVALITSGLYFFFIARPANAQIDSIAVLPLENLSADPDLTYAADGLSESLIDHLSQIPKLKVISRHSSFKFRGSNMDMREVGSKLNARAIVTGSISRIGDELNIRVDIVDAAEDRHLAGGQYRRKAADLPRVHNEIARMTVDKLRFDLTDSQVRRVTENGTENSDAYRYYLSGLVELNGSLGSRSRALEYFEQAVKLDPDFAAAYAEIGWVYWNRANASGDPQEVMPKAKAAVDKALAIEPDLAKAHAVRAMVYEYEFDWANAEKEYLRSIELSPNLDFARNNYAFFLSVLDRQDEAFAQLEEQRARDPLNQRLHLLQKGIVLVQARRFDEVLQVYEQAKDFDRSKKVPTFALGYACAGKGLNNEAIAYYQDAVADLGGEEKYSQPLVYLASIYAKMPERRDEARAILTRIEGMNEYVSPALLAIVYAALDENDRAMEMLDEAYIKRDPLLRFIGAGYEYDGLRGDPRFVDLTKKIGLGK
ncbi:MAG: protein kinase [Pyrinomonadaceae bacterium]